MLEKKHPAPFKPEHLSPLKKEEEDIQAAEI